MKLFNTNQISTLRKESEGFTIIELLVATSVFSVVLLALMFGVVQISHIYYKGITESNTQNTARNILNDISQSIQFDGGSYTPPNVGGGNNRICIGSRQYSYLLGYELKSSYSSTLHQSPQVLVEQNGIAACPASAPNLTNGSAPGKELMGQNMRLANLVITPLANNYYKVEVRVAYGDDDLLSNPTGTNASCRGRAGDQFCAVSDLSTIVQKRVN